MTRASTRTKKIVPAAEETQSMTEATAPYQVEQTQPKHRSLFTISDDLEKLNELLDECSDDAQQQELIGSWFEQLGEERDHKLDGYAALITEMQARAEVRKTEAKRMMELAASDEDRAKLLKQGCSGFLRRTTSRQWKQLVTNYHLSRMVASSRSY